MDLVLAKVYKERRKARESEPSYIRGNAKGLASNSGGVRSQLSAVSWQDSVQSLGGPDPSIPKGQRLPHIQRGGRQADGAQTARDGPSDGFATRPPQPPGSDRHAGGSGGTRGHGSSDHEIASSRRSHRRSTREGMPPKRLPTIRPPGELAMEIPSAVAQPEGRQYYTLKIRPVSVTYSRGEGEDEHEPEPGLQVALSIDGMTCITKVVRKEQGEDTAQLHRESFIFQPEGSPVGTLMMIKLLGVRPRVLPQELGTALMDLSSVTVGGHAIELSSPLTSQDGSDTGRRMGVTVSIKVYSRRKSFTFSYLNAEPIFRRAGYAVTADGLQAFPVPFKKKGMPAGVSFFTLRYTQKLAEDTSGHEVWRATDKAGNAYTVKKFLIMDTSCRVLFCSELDGLLDCDPGQGVELCDAFLDGVRLSIVLDEMGGTCLRDALLEKGPAPDMVASVVLRQVLKTLHHMHEDKSRLHNDVDARNIYVCKSGEVRLGGFCYSHRHMGKQSKFAGPYLHMAPERLLGLECSFPADVWSVGMLALELALGKGWHAETDLTQPNALFEYKQRVVTDPCPTLRGVKTCSDELRHFADQCLYKNVRQRWTPSQLLDHPLIEKYESFMLPAGTWVSKRSKEVEEALRLSKAGFTSATATGMGGGGGGQGRTVSSAVGRTGSTVAAHGGFGRTGSTLGQVQQTSPRGGGKEGGGMSPKKEGLHSPR